ACADVKVTADGVTRDATAEIVDDLARKRRLVEEMPFIPLAPSLWLQAAVRGPLRPLALLWLRRWVALRPVVLIRLR
ncbi:MAG: hypothetical protein ACHQ6T_18005, partial [Myxococcota bacterium]